MSEQEAMMQEQMQEQQLKQPGQAITAYSKTVDDLELSKFYLDSDFSRLYKLFTGKVFIRNKMKVVQEDEPMMDEKGVRRIMGWLATYSDLNFRMNNYDEEEVRKITDVFNYEFSMWFINNYENFEVREDEVLLIISVVTDFVEACLRKSMEGGERNFHKGTVQTREIVTNQPKQGGFSLRRLFK